MKKIVAAFVFALFAFLVTSCDGEWTSVQRETFDPRLRGTWISDNHEILLHTEGTLIIGFDTIRIEGFNPIIILYPPDIPDPLLLFHGFARGVQMTGFSEDNKLFINRPGVIGGIPYALDTTARPNLLYLDFGYGINNRAIWQRQ